MTGEASISFDRIADRYDDTRGGLRRGREVAEAIEPHLGDARRVLEVGVGTGAVAVALTEAGRTVLGVDLASAMLRRAGDRIGSRVVQGDALTLPFGTGRVEAAYVVWVLHLVGDPALAMSECARVLRKGGRLIVVAGRPRPDPDTDPDILALFAPMERVRDARVRPDDADSVQRWAAAAGLTLVTRAERQEQFTESPAKMADPIEQRAFSYLWEIDDETWSDVVLPVVAQLRALPDQDRGRVLRQRQDLQVFEKA